jgi:signal transduction histidine kinase/ActR/RegA family two-component response regulator
MSTRNPFRVLRPVDLAAGIYVAAYYAWLAFRTPATPTTGLIGSVAFYPLGPAVAWACWHTSRIRGLDRRTQAGWQLLLVASLLLFISGTAWDVFLHTLGGEAYPPWVDDLELVSLVLVVPAFLLFPGRSFEGPDRIRLLLDTALVAVASSVVALYFAGRLWLADPAEKSLLSALVGPGMDWLILAVAAVGAVQKRDRTTRRALGLLLLASTFFVVGNYYYTVQTGGVTTTIGPGPAATPYRSGDGVDGLWFAAWVLRWVAARWSWYDWSSGASCGGTSAAAAGSEEEGAGFSYLVVACCFILLTSQVFSNDPSFGLLAFSAVVTTALMLARQFVELRENSRLLDEQAAQEARFRSLVDHSSDAVLILDPAGTVTYASSTAPEVFGAGAGIRPGIRLADAVREDDRSSLGPVIAGRSGVGRLALHVPGDEGDWREIEAVWTDQRRDPAVGGIVVNCRDRTAQRDLERRLQHAQKLDAMGQLAGGLAHDINNSLAIIRGYAELLKEELAPGSAAASDLTHVEQAVDRAASITRKVLGFSRRQVSQPTVLDLSSLVGEMLPILRQSVTSQIDVQLQLDARIWPVRADRGQLEQVLVNLAANARDAMPSGGVLAIETSNLVVDAVSPSTAKLPPGEYVTLTVRDQGAGMTPEVRARIFEPFFSTKTAQGGMGLGLAMVHDTVLASRGRIVVDSAPGQGATFRILLPRTEAIPAHTGNGTVPKAAPAAGKTVLIVDDEDKVRLVARRMLERHGYAVLEAADGAEALAILGNASKAIDVLLTDLVMPGIDGRRLIARSAAIRPALAAVCMTGFAGEQDPPLGPGGRAVPFLSKPFSSDALLEAVATAASRSAAA